MLERMLQGAGASATFVEKMLPQAATECCHAGLTQGASGRIRREPILEIAATRARFCNLPLLRLFETGCCFRVP